MRHALGFNHSIVCEAVKKAEHFLVQYLSEAAFIGISITLPCAQHAMHCWQPKRPKIARFQTSISSNTNMFVWDLFLFLISVSLLFPFFLFLFFPFLSSAFLSISFLSFSFLSLLCFLAFSFSRKHYLEPDKVKTLSGAVFLLVPHPSCIGSTWNPAQSVGWRPLSGFGGSSPPSALVSPTAQMLTAKLRFFPLLLYYFILNIVVCSIGRLNDNSSGSVMRLKEYWKGDCT